MVHMNRKLNIYFLNKVAFSKNVFIIFWYQGLSFDSIYYINKQNKKYKVANVGGNARIGTTSAHLEKIFVILQLYWWLFSSTKHCSWKMV